MSAIFGVLSLDCTHPDPSWIERMKEACRPLGCDGEATWSGCGAALGQQLRRITPEDAFEQQPLFGPRQEVVLVSDARIDNRPELAEELGILRSETGCLADSQFILAAYLKWGLEFLSHLIGAFSIALFDSREDQLVLARSPRGQRALVYHEQGSRLAFATAPRGLFALPFISRRLDPERLADHLVTAPPTPGATFYSGIRSLRPGHCLVARRGGTRISQFWAVQPQRPIRFARDEDYEEAFTVLLERVVSDYSRSVSPVSIMLSGGFDSASIAALAATQPGQHGQKFRGYTEVPAEGFSGMIPPGRYADETPLVRSLEAMYPSLEVETVGTDGSFFLDSLQSFFEAAEAPFQNASNRVWVEAIHHRAMQAGRKVLLTGMEGNLTISWGGQNLIPSLLRRFDFGEAISQSFAGVPLKTGCGSLARGLFALVPKQYLIGINLLRHRVRGSVPWSWYSVIHPEFAAEQKVFERGLASGHPFRSVRHEDGRANALVRVDGSTDVTRGYSIMFGTETRSPAGDQRLVEFCFGIPEDQFRRNGVSRSLLRRVMRQRLPDAILDNRRRGLQAADWAERLRSRREQVFAALDQFGASPMVRHSIDLPRARREYEELVRENEISPASWLLKRNLLESALMNGSFIQWVESGITPV